MGNPGTATFTCITWKPQAWIAAFESYCSAVRILWRGEAPQLLKGTNLH